VPVKVACVAPAAYGPLESDMPPVMFPLPSAVNAPRLKFSSPLCVGSVCENWKEYAPYSLALPLPLLVHLAREAALMVNVAGAEVPPDVVTVTLAVPGDAIRFAVTAAVSWIALL